MKNFIKSSFLGLMLVLASFASNAQTKPGFFLGASALTYDVTSSPTKGLVQGEFGYEGKLGSLSAVANTDTKFQTSKTLMVGAKLGVALFHVDAINVKASVEGLRLINAPRANRNWAFTPELGATTTFYKHFDATFAVLGSYHREVFKASRETPGAKGIIDRWRICEPGARFGVKYKF